MRKLKNFKMCSHKPKKIFRLDRINYYAADLQGVELFKGDLVINISGYSRSYSVNKIGKLAKFIDDTSNPKYEEIAVPWPDYSAPRVKTGFWKALHQHALSKGYKSVCFHCYGGHGRTGTALAAMLIENLRVEPMGALQFVREKHCYQAVETDEQIHYLRELHSENFPELYVQQDNRETIQDDEELSEDEALDLGTSDRKYYRR